MTTVGWVGLGKLGLPCAVAMASRGVNVVGYDIDPERRASLRVDRGSPSDFTEPGLSEAWNKATELGTLEVAPYVADLAPAAELIFVCVQTPHAPGYDGSTPAPEERRTFDYTALREAVRSIVDTGWDGVLVVTSTVTPGTMDRCIRPLLPAHVRLVYNPAFPAMGSVIDDVLDPAFVLIGHDGAHAGAEVAKVWDQVLGNAPVRFCSIPSAELAKVAYNTFISAKIVFANALMELCHHTGADVDEVTDTLALATDRVISSRYLRGGMGDGGACHPRDLIAMSAESQRHGLSYDLFGDLVRAREAQTRWLADLALYHAELAGLDTVVVLGKAYKAETSLTTGSAALLLAGMLDGRGVKVVVYDPLVDGPELPYEDPDPAAVFVLATNHRVFRAWAFPPGSIVIDPWRTAWDPRPGVTRIGVGSR